MTVWSQKWWFSHLKAGPNFLSFRWILAFFGGARLGDFLNVACFRLYVIFSKNQRLVSNPKKGTFTAVAVPVFIQYGDYEVLVTPYHTYCQDSHPETLGDIYLCLMPVTDGVCQRRQWRVTLRVNEVSSRSTVQVDNDQSKFRKTTIGLLGESRELPAHSEKVLNLHLPS